MKYAFIDYENIHSLDNINLNEYEKIYLFLGAQQQSITLSEKFNDQIIIHLITIKDVAKNNLDFHLAYFLGKFDQEVDKNIHFDVISKDKGYQGVCDYIQNQKAARQCKLISLTLENTEKNTEKKVPIALKNDSVLLEQNPEEYAIEYQAFMSKTDIRHLPTTIEKLSNHICSQTNVRKLPKTASKNVIPKIIEQLARKKLIVIKENKIVYEITDSVKLYTQYAAFLLKREKLKRPQTLSSLKNEIAAKLNLRGNTAKINEMLDLLKTNDMITYQDNTDNPKLDYKK
ncbi:PIN domain-containing protein [Bisgaard Taxon 45]